MSRARLVTLLCLLATAAEAAPPASPQPGSDRVVTRANRLIDRVVDGATVTTLIGDVRIYDDSLTVASDSALWYRDRDHFEFYRDVRMTRGDAVLTCGEASYDGPTDAAEFSTDVRLVEGDVVATSKRGELRQGGDLLRLIRDARLVAPEYVVFADTITRWKDGERGEAIGDVRIVDPHRQSLVTGEHATFDRADSVVVVDREPMLTSREEGSEPLYAMASRMVFYRAEDRVVMTDSVRIRQGRTRAYADTADVFGRERVRLRGAPRLEDGLGSTMTADEIEFFYEDGKLVRVHLKGDGRVEDDDPAELARQYRGLPASNVLTGDDVVIHLKDEVPNVTVVIGDAHSVYVPADASEEVAFNDVAGDTIVIGFREGKVAQVDVNGNMSGDYDFVEITDLDARAGRVAAVLDSLSPGVVDTLSSVLGDSLLAANRGAALDSLVNVALSAAGENETVAQLAAALGDTAGGAAAIARALADASADTLADGRRTWDFADHQEKVEYSGEEALFDLRRKRIVIDGDGRMVYGTMDLRAGKIRMDLTTRELYASLDPLLVDGSEKIAGREMGYNFQYRTGAVLDGATAMDKFYYVGDEIKRFPDGMLKIHSGKMTSCDLAEPHYHFWADKMKIRPGDKVVAKPIVLKIGRVPIFGLPFYFKSLKSGRRSGILFPSFNFGWSQRTGRYIRDWGYYWATSDYTDFTFQGDWNERSELTWRISNRYVKRYGFSGDFSYSRRSSLGDGPKIRQWQLTWNHRQDHLFDAYQFQTGLRMSSRTITRQDLLSDLGGAAQVNGQQTSTARISRNWSVVSGSLNFKRDEYVNKEDADPSTNNLISTQSFPQLGLSFKSTALLPQLSPGRKGGFLGNILRSTYFRNSYSFSTNRRTYETTRNTVHTASGTGSLDFKQQRLLIFNVNTGVSASQSWTRDTTDGHLFVFDDVDSNYVAREVRERSEQTSTSFSINSGLNTTMYGVFRPRLGRLRAIRHTLRLGVSHRLTPSIPGKQARRESFGFTLGNRFDVKYLSGAAGDSGAVKKLDGVLDWSLTGGYTPEAARDKRWSTINSSLTMQPGTSRALRVTVNQTFAPYSKRVTSTRFTYGVNVAGRVDTGGRVLKLERERNHAIDLLGVEQDTVQAAPADTLAAPEDQADDLGFGQFATGGEGSGQDTTDGGRYIPWRFGSNLSYSKDYVTDRTTANVSLNLSVTVTRNWNLSWRSAYNLVDGTLTSQSWDLSRDLHCWTMRFSRSVSAVDSQFGFIIALKSIPDVKVTRGKQDLVGSLGRATGGIF